MIYISKEIAIKLFFIEIDQFFILVLYARVTERNGRERIDRNAEEDI